MRRVLVLVDLIGCYSPAPVGGKCATGDRCPTPLACNHATQMCEASPNVDASTPFPELSGLQWLLPCTTPPASNFCSCTKVVKMAVGHAAGGPHFDVTIHIRGVMESGGYIGGMGSGAFYTGGLPGTPFANVYRLDVSAPPAHYFINAGSGPVAAIDYMTTIPIDDGATVTLTADGQDGGEIANGSNLVIPGVVTVPSPYDGQFAQLDVVSATSM